MDSDRRTLKALFYDYPVNLALEIALHGSPSLMGVFERLVNIRETRYNQASMKALGQMVRYDRMHCHRGDNAYDELYKGLKLPFSYAEKVLSYNDTDHLCVVNYDALMRWNEMSKYVGEELMTVSYLAKKDIDCGYDRVIFTWNPILSHDCKSLNDELSANLPKGLCDIHLHLMASTDVFEFNWISLMNNILNHKKVFNQLTHPLDSPALVTRCYNYEDLYKWCVLACFIRWELYQRYLKGNKDAFGSDFEEEFRSLSKLSPFYYHQDLAKWQGRINRERRSAMMNSEGKVVDYAITDFFACNDQIGSPYMLYHGERILLYSFYRDYWNNDDTAYSISKYVFLYELIKCQLRREIVQVNMLPGMGNFQDYNQRKSLFVGEDWFEMAVKYAVQTTMPNPQDGMEARIMPQNNFANYKRLLDGNYHQQIFGKGDVFSRNSLHERMTYIVHFSKKACTRNNRFGELKKTIKKQAQILIELMKEKRDRCHVVGIDAAGNESNCRPEVFAHVYRYCKASGLRNFTYHAGEDFYDITEGLRTIEESIRLLQMNSINSDGCHYRLGHCVALGIDAKSYYANRNKIVMMPKQVLMDNLVWLLKYCEKEGVHVSTSIESRLKEQIQMLYNEIGYIQPFSYESYYNSMLLRGDDQKYYSDSYGVWGDTALDDSVDGEIRKDGLAKALLSDYINNPGIFRNGFMKSIDFKVPYGYDKLIKKVQNKLMRLIRNRGICVECNPTSNVRISRLDKYENHPVFRFVRLNCVPCKDLKVTINTDDKGIFVTSLQRELSLLALALKKQKVKGERNKWGEISINKYIGKLARNGQEQRFK